MKTTQQTPNYLIELSDFLDKPIENLVNEIKEIEGIKLSDLKVRDLTYCNDKLIEPGQGVYVFKTEENKILYIGKVSSNSFTERIPKHFDIRPGAWFNGLIKNICKKHLKKEVDEKSCREASKFVFENGKLVLINTTGKSRIGKLESILKATAEPLNQTSPKDIKKVILLDILPAHT